ncbi:O-antigen ligase family protein, partial [Photobacterium swingsii]|uniref:O-antigen ligase family protein n=1 Tax=Photobacterium swingsii TaxID=680026 RepID=UPI003D147F32
MFNSKLEKNLIICLLLLFVVITGSSKGFIGVAFVSVMYVLFTQKIVNLAKYLLVFLFVSISLIPFADKSISRLSDKFVSITTFDLNSVDSKSIGHDSGKIRLYLMINAFNIALKHPLIGVGVNNGQLYLPLPDSFSRNMDSINSQNNLTEMLLNGGIPSFALYYFPLLFFLYKSLLRKDKNDI